MDRQNFKKIMMEFNPPSRVNFIDLQYVTDNIFNLVASLDEEYYNEAKDILDIISTNHKKAIRDVMFGGRRKDINYEAFVNILLLSNRFNTTAHNISNKLYDIMR